MKVIITRPLGSTWDGYRIERNMAVIPHEGETVKLDYAYFQMSYMVVKVTWDFDHNVVIINLIETSAKDYDVAAMRRYVNTSV